MNKRRQIIILISIFSSIIVFIVINIFVLPLIYPANTSINKTVPTETEKPIEKITKTIIKTKNPEISSKDTYTILLLGDSMTDYLRPHYQILITDLKSYYPNTEFVILNYGYGATNILSVKDRLRIETEYNQKYFDPINEVEFDIIMIESFGYNPLSQHGIEEGLSLQTDELFDIYNEIRQSHSNSHIIFVSTIAPNKKLFATNSVDLSEEQRVSWANERISYINNHINFAVNNEIPLLNIFEKSLDDGEGDLRYISESDYIHPSAKGVHFIYEEIAKYIYENGLLPL